MLPKVLLVTNEYPPERIAGTAMATQFLVEELVSRGGSVLVAVNNRKLAPSREVNGGLAVHRFRPFDFPMTRMAQRAALLASLARQNRPDVIQGQSLSCGCLAVLAGRCLGIPVVTYVQGQDLYAAGLWARRTYIRWALTYSDRVVAVTADLRAEVHRLSDRRTEIIPHGLKVRDAHKLDRRSARSLLGLRAEEALVLFVGRLISLKGVDYAIRAMARVVSRRPHAHLLIVGQGEEYGRLRQLTRHLNLEQHVTFLGERSHEDVIRFMRASDVFILPSLSEAFGIVLVEAMSCGLPIVASDVMGIPSIVKDGTNGFLVAPGDDAGLADHVTRLLADEDERTAIGRHNIQAAERYAIPRIADRFLSVWTEAIAVCARVRHQEGTGNPGRRLGRRMEKTGHG